MSGVKSSEYVSFTSRFEDVIQHLKCRITVTEAEIKYFHDPAWIAS